LFSAAMPFEVSGQKYPGITSPISFDGPKPVDLKLSKKLEEIMRPFGVFESEEALAHRWVVLYLLVVFHNQKLAGGKCIYCFLFQLLYYTYMYIFDYGGNKSIIIIIIEIDLSYLDIML